MAEYARERRETGYGYPQIYHFFDPRAWLALVGHPRVELQGSEEPVEVIRGRVQLVAASAASFPFCTVGFLIRAGLRLCERYGARGSSGSIVYFFNDSSDELSTIARDAAYVLPHTWVPR